MRFSVAQSPRSLSGHVVKCSACLLLVCFILVVRKALLSWCDLVLHMHIEGHALNGMAFYIIMYMYQTSNEDSKTSIQPANNTMLCSNDPWKLSALEWDCKCNHPCTGTVRL